MAHNFSSATQETLAGHRTLTSAEVNECVIWSFDPDGSARNLVLPTPANHAGALLCISNTAGGAEVITIQDPTGPTTVCTPTQNEGAVVWCDGSIWRGGTVTAS